MRIDWAIDAVIAGAPYRFATRKLEVDGYVYQAGLGDLTLSKRVDFSEGIDIEIRTNEDWPSRIAAAGFLPDGGTATLWLVVTEDDGTSRRVLWARGRVGSVQWDRQGKPLRFELREVFRRLPLPNPRERIDPYTAPSSDSGLPSHTGSWNLYTDNQGEFYPIIVGYPGYDDASGDLWPVVPLPTIQYSDVAYNYVNDDGSTAHPEDKYEVLIHVVGVGDIQAERVAVTDAGLTRTIFDDGGATQHSLSRDGFVFNVDPDLATDKLGQRFKWIPQDLSTVAGTYGIEDWNGEPEVFAAFSPAANWGGGILHRGQLVRGAASIFSWVFGAYTDVVIDVGAQAANATALDAYVFDTFINTEQDAIDWFEGEILDDLQCAAIARGEHGLYLAHLPLRAGRADVTSGLVVGAEGVQWVAMSVASFEDVANEITVRWAQQRDGSSYLNTRTLTAEYQGAVAVPGGGVYRDTRAVAHALCLASQRALGEVRPVTIDLPTVWSQATALQIGADVALRRAFPERLITLSLPVEQWTRTLGEVVELTAADRGIAEALCVLDDVRVSATRIEVDLRPLRGMESYL